MKQQGFEQLWLLTHPDLRTTARIKAIYQTIQAELVQCADLIEGSRPRTLSTVG